MSDASTGSQRATGDASTPLEERAFGEAGFSFEAHARLRQSATARQRNWRRNKGMGLGVRPVRLSRKDAQKPVELGYLSLESKGDPKKEGVAIEASPARHCRAADGPHPEPKLLALAELAHALRRVSPGNAVTGVV